MIGTKSLGIRFDKVVGFIRVYYRTRYVVLFDLEKDPAIFNRNRYLIGVKSGVTYAFSHIYARIKVDSYDSLPLEKTLTFHNVIILIKDTQGKGTVK